MSERWRFDRQEIEFVAQHMDCHTRHYVEAACKAAKRRARKWTGEPGEAMTRAARTMDHALKTWSVGQFDMAIDPLPA